MATVSRKIIDLVIPRWNSGESPYEIATNLNISNQTVYRALHAAEIYPDGTGSKMYSETIPHVECDPLWAAEFRGLFYGEGTAYIARRKWKKGFLYTPSLVLSARADNLEMIKDIQVHLGGKVQMFLPSADKRGYVHKPQCRWYIVGYATVRAIIEATNLHLGLNKTNKIDEVMLLYQIILERFKMPYRLGPSNLEVIESGYVRLQDMKRYKGSSG